MTRRVKFVGGPEDGAEKVFATPLNVHMHVLGQPFSWKSDGVVTGKGRKVYIYHLESLAGTAAFVYSFVGETIQTLEGGAPDVTAQARGGGDSPGPEPEPEPDEGIVGGVE